MDGAICLCTLRLCRVSVMNSMMPYGTVVLCDGRSVLTCDIHGTCTYLCLVSVSCYLFSYNQSINSYWTCLLGRRSSLHTLCHAMPCIL